MARGKHWKFEVKIVFSITGRFREDDHDRVTSIYLSENLPAETTLIFKSLVIYSSLAKLGLLGLMTKFFWFVSFASKGRVLIVCSDRHLLRHLRKEGKTVRGKISSHLINLFWNDWRELEEFSDFAECCYLVGGRGCITINDKFHTINQRPRPAINSHQREPENVLDRITFAGKAYQNFDEIYNSLPIQITSPLGIEMVSDLETVVSFDRAKSDENQIILQLKSLECENEKLGIWTVYRNMVRLAFLNELKNSALHPYVFGIGSALKDQFGFQGLRDTFDKKKVNMIIRTSKVNLDLGSQVLRNSFYDRSCRILELAPVSLLQASQIDAQQIYGPLKQQITFETFEEFEGLAQERLKTRTGTFDQTKQQIASMIASGWSRGQT